MVWEPGLCRGECMCVRKRRERAQITPLNLLYVSARAGVLSKNKNLLTDSIPVMSLTCSRGFVSPRLDMYVVFFYVYFFWKQHVYVPALSLQPRLSAAYVFQKQSSYTDFLLQRLSNRSPLLLMRSLLTLTHDVKLWLFNLLLHDRSNKSFTGGGTLFNSGICCLVSF